MSLSKTPDSDTCTSYSKTPDSRMYVKDRLDVGYMFTKSNTTARDVLVEANLLEHLIEMKSKVNDSKQYHSILNV